MATFPLAVLRPQAHMASSPAALLRYATVEGEQGQLAAEEVSQELRAARALRLQAQVCQLPRVPESEGEGEGETQFEQALRSKSVPASQQSAASPAGREALLPVPRSLPQTQWHPPATKCSGQDIPAGQVYEAAVAW
jgi:hypothetical protein